MEKIQKQQISNEVAAMALKLSQNKIAIKAGVSSATINHIINGKWIMIKEEMWRKVQAALKIDLNWVHADTKKFTALTQLLESTQAGSMAIGIAMKEGRSKSHTYKRYEKMHEDVIYVECKNYWTKKTYVQALLRAAGLHTEGTVGEVIEYFVDHVRSLHNPMIVIDQADKLKDPSLDLFMDFYNDLDNCAFVLSGTPALQKRILRGVLRDKVGYRELYSRIARRFITLADDSLVDVTKICSMNGVTDEDSIIEIFNESEGDSRRVRRSIEKYRLMNAKQTA